MQIEKRAFAPFKLVKPIVRIVGSGGVKPWQSAAVRHAKEKAANLFCYVVLLSLSFIFIYPILFLVSKSMMQASDLTDATVQWIPRQLSFANYAFAYGKLVYWKSFVNSSVIALGTALIQIISCAVVGYGFARYRFPGYHILLGFVLFTFLVPPQTIVVPLFMFFSDLGWINTYLPFLVPALFGHGLRGALFVLIFIQFFRGLPHQLEEAARIDGAGPYRTFATVMFPLARPAMLVVFLFAVVWNWNDVFQPNLYVMQPDVYNLTQKLSIMNGEGEQELAKAGLSSTMVIGAAPTMLNRIMAGSLLTLVPMLAMYLFTQRYFVESVERTGIAGE